MTDILSIHQRIGGKIHPKLLKRTLEELFERDEVHFEGGPIAGNSTVLCQSTLY